MKRIFFPLLMVAALAACNSADKPAEDHTGHNHGQETDKAAEIAKTLQDSANYTSIEWLDSTFKDMGKIKKGQKIEVSFPLKNIGNKNLVISQVDAGCGCTVPEKPEKPIAPGGQEVIKAVFDSQNQSVGTPLRKTVSVVANTMPSTTHLLTFSVTVVE
ncbi:DUF1573 domain-containing protein [Terrimonas rubra]|uniref:Type IV secretion system putative lipoprotein virB7 n=1 Tax=Terrimonas rubra TaxID=1035890 RepID=A0ABW6A5Q4_9BACT